jgi:hypothetical protein
MAQTQLQINQALQDSSVTSRMSEYVRDNILKVVEDIGWSVHDLLSFDTPSVSTVFSGSTDAYKITLVFRAKDGKELFCTDHIRTLELMSVRREEFVDVIMRHLESMSVKIVDSLFANIGTTYQEQRERHYLHLSNAISVPVNKPNVQVSSIRLQESLQEREKNTKW